MTGGSGLVGNALKKFCPDAVFVDRKDADLTDLCQVQNLFKKYRPQKVIHLAAKVAGVKTNAEKNADMFGVNVQINTNVLSTAQQFHVEKLVGILSSCTFEESPEKPPTEQDIHKKMPFAGHQGYAYSKRMLDIQIHLLRQQYGCNFSSILPVTIIGPHDNWDYNESHVAGALIHKCLLAQRQGTPLEVWGTGASVRQFIYSQDVARLLLEVLENYHQSETLIVASDQGTSIKTLAETIAEIIGFKGQLHFDPTQPEGQKIRVLDYSKFKKIFPNFKFTPLTDALKYTIEWFQQNKLDIK